jgi:hypothetical protein
VAEKARALDDLDGSLGRALLQHARALSADIALEREEGAWPGDHGLTPDDLFGTSIDDLVGELEPTAIAHADAVRAAGLSDAPPVADRPEGDPETCPRADPDVAFGRIVRRLVSLWRDAEGLLRDPVCRSLPVAHGECRSLLGGFRGRYATVLFRVVQTYIACREAGPGLSDD